MTLSAGLTHYHRKDEKMAAELISFGAGADWIKKLWGILWQRRKTYKKELDEINDVMFGDPLDLARYYVEPDCQEFNPADRHEEDFLVAREPVMKKTDQFFLSKAAFEQGSNQMFVLSDAGMGKSSLLTMLKLLHLTSFWPQNKGCILKKLGEKTLEQLAAVENKRETILLLDSLDEDPMAYARVEERLLEILQATQHFFKVIITCRTQFFPKTEKDPLERNGLISIGSFTCPAKYLSFFTDDKVLEYLKKRFPKKLWILPDRKNIEESQKIIARMGSLRCRPMLLSYIKELKEAPLINDSEYKIYDALVKTWLKREKGKPGCANLSEKEILHACIILAVIMQIRKERSVSEEELDAMIAEISEVKPILHLDFKGRSLLNRNSEGHFRFSHYSIQEFCVAKFFAEEPVFTPRKSVPLTEFIFRMMVTSGKSLSFTQLMDYSNLDFRNSNLSGARLQGFDLSGKDISGANLSGADFSNADFSNCKLTGTVFKNANLKGADFEGSDFWNADFEGAKIESLPPFRNDLGMEFVFILPGSFMMGSPKNEPGRSDDEILHNVTLTKGFFMQTTQVTQKQWKSVMGNNPSHFKECDDCPVENVSWDDVHEFIDKLNKKKGHTYRLPTEAEWEYACRAGSETAFCFGDDESQLEHYAWYDRNSGGRTHPVAQRNPNAWGLYDMHGNVWEWCQDWYGNYYADSVTNPEGSSTGSDRVFRGGCWYDYARRCRSANRNSNAPCNRNSCLGFRLVLSPGQQ